MRHDVFMSSSPPISCILIIVAGILNVIAVSVLLVIGCAFCKKKKDKDKDKIKTPSRTEIDTPAPEPKPVIQLANDREKPIAADPSETPEPKKKDNCRHRKSLSDLVTAKSIILQSEKSKSQSAKATPPKTDRSSTARSPPPSYPKEGPAPENDQGKERNGVVLVGSDKAPISSKTKRSKSSRTDCSRSSRRDRAVGRRKRKGGRVKVEKSKPILVREDDDTLDEEGRERLRGIKEGKLVVMPFNDDDTIIDLADFPDLPSDTDRSDSDGEGQPQEKSVML